MESLCAQTKVETRCAHAKVETSHEETAFDRFSSISRYLTGIEQYCRSFIVFEELSRRLIEFRNIWR